MTCTTPGATSITITQYLRPSLRHHPVERWVKPEEFVELQAEAMEIGFAGALSGPLVRSSYRAGAAVPSGHRGPRQRRHGLIHPSTSTSADEAAAPHGQLEPRR